MLGLVPTNCYWFAPINLVRWTMKPSFLSALLGAVCALVLVNLSPVHALDCAKASSPVDKLICATPDLKMADEEMGAAFFKLLRDTTDPAFHEALIQSQRRWLKVRESGPDRFGQAEDDKTDDRVVLLGMTRDRLTFLRTGAAIRVMEQERTIMSKDNGGPFAGFRTFCVLQPPPYGGWNYACWGEAHRQHNGRICSAVSEWASGHMSEYRVVSVLKNGEPRLVATCSTDEASTSDPCPEPDNDAAAKAVGRWSTNPELPRFLTVPHTDGLWTYDPDIEPDQLSQEWMRDCLFAPAYPLPELSRPDSKKGNA
jgi:uncharacterized protein YecT (DUF1311 family)